MQFFSLSLSSCLLNLFSSSLVITSILEWIINLNFNQVSSHPISLMFQVQSMNVWMNDFILLFNLWIKILLNWFSFHWLKQVKRKSKYKYRFRWPQNKIECVCVHFIINKNKVLLLFLFIQGLNEKRSVNKYLRSPVELFDPLD